MNEITGATMVVNTLPPPFFWNHTKIATRNDGLQHQQQPRAQHGKQRVDAEPGLTRRIVEAVAETVEQDPHGRQHRLHGRSLVRALVVIVRLGDHFRQDAFASQRVHVAGRRVVEGHAAGKRAGEDQEEHQFIGPAPTKLWMGVKKKFTPSENALATMSASVG